MADPASLLDPLIPALCRYAYALVRDHDDADDLVQDTLIGIALGHWMFGAPFTATSMIGFIALAGIIVRNSVLLADFIQHRRTEGAALRDALLEAGAIRFKPIFLTAAAAMIGTAFILTDPIFQGLAISMVFGLASSTAVTVLVIPAIFVWLRDDGRAAHSLS